MPLSAIIIGLCRARTHDADQAQMTSKDFVQESNPWFAAILTLIVMLSMAGVPPFLGFWAKWSCATRAG